MLACPPSPLSLTAQLALSSMAAPGAGVVGPPSVAAVAVLAACSQERRQCVVTPRQQTQVGPQHPHPRHSCHAAVACRCASPVCVAASACLLRLAARQGWPPWETCSLCHAPRGCVLQTELLQAPLPVKAPAVRLVARPRVLATVESSSAACAQSAHRYSMASQRRQCSALQTALGSAPRACGRPHSAQSLDLSKCGAGLAAVSNSEQDACVQASQGVPPRAFALVARSMRCLFCLRSDVMSSKSSAINWYTLRTREFSGAGVTGARNNSVRE